MNEIRAEAKTVREVLARTRFGIDYYQREYRWETKQVQELLEDLTSKFLVDFDPNHDRREAEHYGQYFLGSIILSDKGDLGKYVVDGQQRLTSLTLLLIRIYRTLSDPDQKSQIGELVFSLHYGKRSFNLDVLERADCMEALFNGIPFGDTDQPESVQNILKRYQDLEENWPEKLDAHALSYFADWLIGNVMMVVITAYSDSDAYAIFETMNDRGLSLTPTEMLKGYLLSNIDDGTLRSRAEHTWRERVEALKKFGKDEDADSIKAWLRSQYAQTSREHRTGAKPQDFDLLGTEFHRWVRDHQDSIGLHTASDFANFIQKHFAFFAGWYEFNRSAADTYRPKEGLESIFYNAENNFTLQYPVLLAPLIPGESRHNSLLKMRLVATYLDILITRRIWNNRAIDYSTVQYAMFLFMREIRSKSVDELVEVLQKRLAEQEETFATNDRFQLNGGNGKQIHRILARITEYVETESGRASRYVEYSQRGGKNAYEIEHIWADRPGRHLDEFDHPADFQEYRNRIGGLLLLPKRFNASFSDLPYEEKLKEYVKSQNLLAQSLGGVPTHDTGFRAFVGATDLRFQAHQAFKKADLDDRQALYRQIAEMVWGAERLEKISAGA